MPFRRDRNGFEWFDVPRTKVSFQEGRAGILQLDAHKEFSPNHTLDLLICKTTLYEGCTISSKLLPLVVAMWERKEDERLNDFYSFDNNGVCLSHGYSRIKNGKRVVNEQHDIDISRLVEYGEIIKELIRDYPFISQLAGDRTVMDLRENTLGQKTV
ncbi:MAG: hypothetical protein Q7S06_01195 [Nanoarchaeota archaeon]|nr:hypothetical protein [Nanoarchaeota archaeon]